MARTTQGTALATLAQSEDEIRAKLAVFHQSQIDKADHGDQEAMQDLDALYDRAPFLLKAHSGLQESVESAFLDLLVPPQSGRLFDRRLRERQIDRLRADLLGPNPTSLERLQVDRIVLCWLQAAHADLTYARCLADGGCLDVGFHEKRAEQAQRRLERAILALATLRRLLTPSIQLNVAKQQVNVASAAMVSASP